MKNILKKSVSIVIIFSMQLQTCFATVQTIYNLNSGASAVVKSGGHLLVDNNNIVKNIIAPITVKRGGILAFNNPKATLYGEITVEQEGVFKTNVLRIDELPIKSSPNAKKIIFHNESILYTTETFTDERGNFTEFPCINWYIGGADWQTIQNISVSKIENIFVKPEGTLRIRNALTLDIKRSLILETLCDAEINENLTVQRYLYVDRSAKVKVKDGRTIIMNPAATFESDLQMLQDFPWFNKVVFNFNSVFSTTNVLNDSQEDLGSLRASIWKIKSTINQADEFPDDPGQTASSLKYPACSVSTILVNEGAYLFSTVDNPFTLNNSRFLLVKGTFKVLPYSLFSFYRGSALAIDGTFSVLPLGQLKTDRPLLIPLKSEHFAENSILTTEEVLLDSLDNLSRIPDHITWNVACPGVQSIDNIDIERVGNIFININDNSTLRIKKNAINKMNMQNILVKSGGTLDLEADDTQCVLSNPNILVHPRATLMLNESDFSKIRNFNKWLENNAILCTNVALDDNIYAVGSISNLVTWCIGSKMRYSGKNVSKNASVSSGYQTAYNLSVSFSKLIVDVGAYLYSDNLNPLAFGPLQTTQVKGCIEILPYSELYINKGSSVTVENGGKILIHDKARLRTDCAEFMPKFNPKSWFSFGSILQTDDVLSDDENGVGLIPNKVIWNINSKLQYTETTSEKYQTGYFATRNNDTQGQTRYVSQINVLPNAFLYADATHPFNLGENQTLYVHPRGTFEVIKGAVFKIGSKCQIINDGFFQIGNQGILELEDKEPKKIVDSEITLAPGSILYTRNRFEDLPSNFLVFSSGTIWKVGCSADIITTPMIQTAENSNSDIIVASGAKIYIDKDAPLSVQNEEKINLESNGEIIVQAGGNIKIYHGAIISGSGQIIIKDAGTLVTAALALGTEYWMTDTLVSKQNALCNKFLTSTKYDNRVISNAAQNVEVNLTLDNETATNFFQKGPYGGTFKNITFEGNNSVFISDSFFSEFALFDINAKTWFINSSTTMGLMGASDNCGFYTKITVSDTAKDIIKDYLKPLSSSTYLESYKASGAGVSKDFILYSKEAQSGFCLKDHPTIKTIIVSEGAFMTLQKRYIYLLADVPDALTKVLPLTLTSGQVLKVYGTLYFNFLNFTVDPDAGTATGSAATGTATGSAATGTATGSATTGTTTGSATTVTATGNTTGGTATRNTTGGTTTGNTTAGTATGNTTGGTRTEDVLFKKNGGEVSIYGRVIFDSFYLDAQFPSIESPKPMCRIPAVISKAMRSQGTNGLNINADTDNVNIPYGLDFEDFKTGSVFQTICNITSFDFLFKPNQFIDLIVGNGITYYNQPNLDNLSGTAVTLTPVDDLKYVFSIPAGVIWEINFEAITGTQVDIQSLPPVFSNNPHTPTLGLSSHFMGVSGFLGDIRLLKQAVVIAPLTFGNADQFFEIGSGATLYFSFYHAFFSTANNVTQRAIINFSGSKGLVFQNRARLIINDGAEICYLRKKAQDTASDKVTGMEYGHDFSSFVIRSSGILQTFKGNFNDSPTPIEDYSSATDQGMQSSWLKDGYIFYTMKTFQDVETRNLISGGLDRLKVDSNKPDTEIWSTPINNFSYSRVGTWWIGEKQTMETLPRLINIVVKENGYLTLASKNPNFVLGNDYRFLIQRVVTPSSHTRISQKITVESGGTLEILPNILDIKVVQTSASGDFKTYIATAPAPAYTTVADQALIANVLSQCLEVQSGGTLKIAKDQHLGHQNWLKQGCNVIASGVLSDATLNILKNSNIDTLTVDINPIDFIENMGQNVSALSGSNVKVVVKKSLFGKTLATTKLKYLHLENGAFLENPSDSTFDFEEGSTFFVDELATIINLGSINVKKGATFISKDKAFSFISGTSSFELIRRINLMPECIFQTNMDFTDDINGVGAINPSWIWHIATTQTLSSVNPNLKNIRVLKTGVAEGSENYPLTIYPGVLVTVERGTEILRSNQTPTGDFDTGGIFKTSNSLGFARITAKIKGMLKMEEYAYLNVGPAAQISVDGVLELDKKTVVNGDQIIFNKDSVLRTNATVYTDVPGYRQFDVTDAIFEPTVPFTKYGYMDPGFTKFSLVCSLSGNYSESVNYSDFTAGAFRTIYVKEGGVIDESRLILNDNQTLIVELGGKIINVSSTGTRQRKIQIRKGGILGLSGTSLRVNGGMYDFEDATPTQDPFAPYDGIILETNSVIDTNALGRNILWRMKADNGPINGPIPLGNISMLIIADNVVSTMPIPGGVTCVFEGSGKTTGMINTGANIILNNDVPPGLTTSSNAVFVSRGILEDSPEQGLGLLNSVLWKVGSRATHTDPVYQTAKNLKSSVDVMLLRNARLYNASIGSNLDMLQDSRLEVLPGDTMIFDPLNFSNHGGTVFVHENGRLERSKENFDFNTVNFSSGSNFVTNSTFTASQNIPAGVTWIVQGDPGQSITVPTGVTLKPVVDIGQTTVTINGGGIFECKPNRGIIYASPGSIVRINLAELLPSATNGYTLETTMKVEQTLWSSIAPRLSNQNFTWWISKGYENPDIAFFRDNRGNIFFKKDSTILLNDFWNMSSTYVRNNIAEYATIEYDNSSHNDNFIEKFNSKRLNCTVSGSSNLILGGLIIQENATLTLNNELTIPVNTGLTLKNGSKVINPQRLIVNGNLIIYDNDLSDLKSVRFGTDAMVEIKKPVFDCYSSLGVPLKNVNIVIDLENSNDEQSLSTLSVGQQTITVKNGQLLASAMNPLTLYPSQTLKFDFVVPTTQTTPPSQIKKVSFMIEAGATAIISCRTISKNGEGTVSFKNYGNLNLYAGLETPLLLGAAIFTGENYANISISNPEVSLGQVPASNRFSPDLYEDVKLAKVDIPHVKNYGRIVVGQGGVLQAVDNQSSGIIDVLKGGLYIYPNTVKGRININGGILKLSSTHTTAPALSDNLNILDGSTIRSEAATFNPANLSAYAKVNWYHEGVATITRDIELKGFISVQAINLRPYTLTVKHTSSDGNVSEMERGIFYLRRGHLSQGELVLDHSTAYISSSDNSAYIMKGASEIYFSSIMGGTMRIEGKTTLRGSRSYKDNRCSLIFSAVASATNRLILSNLYNPNAEACPNLNCDVYIEDIVFWDFRSDSSWQQNQIPKQFFGRGNICLTNGSTLALFFLNGIYYFRIPNIIKVEGNARLIMTGMTTRIGAYMIGDKYHDVTLAPGEYTQVLSRSNSGSIAPSNFGIMAPDAKAVTPTSVDTEPWKIIVAGGGSLRIITVAADEAAVEAAINPNFSPSNLFFMNGK